MKALWLVFVVCFCAVACGVAKEAEQELESVRPQRGPLVAMASFYGELEAASSTAVHAPAASEVDGFTVETVLPDGSMVKSGDVVLTFVKGPIEDELRSHDASYEVAQAELRREQEVYAKKQIAASLEIERASLRAEEAELDVKAKESLVSAVEHEKAQVRLEKARLDLATAKKAATAFRKEREAALEVKRLSAKRAQDERDEVISLLQKMELRAPADGVIFAPYATLSWVRSKVRPGSVVRPGDKLLEIPKLDAFVARLYVRPREAAGLSVGDPLEIHAAIAPGTVFKGRVSEIDAFASTRNERMGTTRPDGFLKEVRVTASLEGVHSALRPGATVRAELKKVLSKDALRIPLASVAERQGKSYVQLESKELRQVKLGASSLSQVEVREGLAQNESILAQAPALLP